MKGLSTTLLVFLLPVSSAKGEENKDWCYGDYAFGIAVGVGVVAAAPLALSAAGFTAGGVAAGSLAAGVQSVVYGGAVGSASTFAVLQSVGAAGMGVGAKVLMGSAAGGAATYVKNKLFPCNVAGKPRCSSGEKWFSMELASCKKKKRK